MVHQLLAIEGFVEKGKRVLRAMNERIDSLTRKDRHLKRENTKLRLFNESLRRS